MISFNPIHEIFSVGPFHVYSWGLMFVIGFIVASYLILREAEKKKVDQGFILNVLLLILLGAIIGGRLFFIIENLPYFLKNLGEIFAFGKGGETSFGGIFLSILFVWIYTKVSKNKNKIKFSQVLDLIAPYVILGLAIGRIGCFLNWDDFGIQSSLPWAVKVADDVSRHPTQIYETIYCLVIVGLLIWFKKIKETGKFTKFRKLLNKDGALFLIFLILYSFFRFFNDFLRLYENYFLGLATSQWILIILFIVSAWILWKKK
jgi:phosphatidylglycerol:prolipoprotein diacylglycerol transferase